MSESASKQYKYQEGKRQGGICVYGGCKETSIGRYCRRHQDKVNLDARNRRLLKRFKSQKLN